MKKTKIIKFAQSLVFLPIITMIPISSLPGSGAVAGVTPAQVIAQAVIQVPQGPAPIDPVLVKEAGAIDAYFNKRNMPLQGTGMEMVQAAEENNLDWRLLPAIAVRESTGGKNACDKVQNNPFGWDSCKVGFNSLNDAIDTLAANLGGNNPSTAKHYDNKTTIEILHTYNPPSVVPNYAQEVMSIMDTIGDADLAKTTSSNTVAIANI